MSTVAHEHPSLPPSPPLPPAFPTSSHLPSATTADIQPAAPSLPTSSHPPPVTTPRLDDFRVEHHPGSDLKHKTIIYSFDEFRRERPQTNFAADMDEPWQPFATRADFEFAEITQEARMSQELIGRLLKLISNVRTGEAELTFTSQNDVRRAWEHASRFYPTVCN